MEKGSDGGAGGGGGGCKDSAGTEDAVTMSGAGGEKTGGTGPESVELGGGMASMLNNLQVRQRHKSCTRRTSGARWQEGRRAAAEADQTLR